METLTERRAIARTTQLNLIRIHEVVKICGLSRSSIYNAMALEDFPKPVAVGTRARAWIRHEVENWLGRRIRQTRTMSSDTH